MTYYYGEIVNLSIKNLEILNSFYIVNVKGRFLGIVKIYTVKVPDTKIEEMITYLQANMSTKLNKEWYITFYNKREVIIVFQERVFCLSGKGIMPVHGKMLDVSNAEEMEYWKEVIEYAKKLGIPDNQCDFLPESFKDIMY